MKIEKIKKRGWVESIKKRNKDFKKLSRKRRVVELCKEGLVLIKSGVIVAEQGIYVGSTIWDMTYLKNITKDTQIQEIIPQIENCDVCAKGSMMLASISLRDECTVGDVCDVKNYEVCDRLEIDIPEIELDLMEIVFEAGNCSKLHPFNKQKTNTHNARSYWDRYKIKDEHQSLWHLLQNIIFCKGNVIKAITKKDTGIGKLRYPKIVTG